MTGGVEGNTFFLSHNINLNKSINTNVHLSNCFAVNLYFNGTPIHIPCQQEVF